MNRQEFIEYLASKLDNCPVLKSLAIAQACLESAFGTKSFYNNIYGIKCHDTKAYAGCRLGRTSEVINGSYKHGLKLAFQTYDNIDDSIADYSRLMNVSRYKRVRDADNYIDVTAMIKACGYATSLTYINSLRRLIVKYKLYEWDSDMNMDGDTQLTTNFKFKEFYCHGVRPPDRYVPNIIEVAKQLQKLRDVLGIPITITSGYRTKEFNASLSNSSSRSQHLLGKAADIRCGVDPRELIFVVGKFTDIRRIGVGRGISHVDIADPTTGDYDMWYY